MRLALAWLVVACGGAREPATYPSGADKDDGAGVLARQSMQLALGGDEPAPDRARDPEPDDYGGASYGGWAMPQWTFSTPNRMPRYTVVAGASGTLEGVVTWTGALPSKLASACGPIDNPTLHVGADRGVGDVVVYIDKVAAARPLPYYGRPASVGGVIAKRGCALVPAVQPVTPLPGSLAVYGDAGAARVRIAPPGEAARMYELEAGGVVRVEAKAGVTRVDGEDGKLVAAWAIGIDSPSYAITDDRGRFHIEELVPGTYDVTIWQAPVATSSGAGTFAYGTPIIVHRTVKIDARHATRLDVGLR
ncbi:MAG TPA: hypothetical protein VGF94_24565 [Kofleriaceae bacterium]